MRYIGDDVDEDEVILCSEANIVYNFLSTCLKLNLATYRVIWGDIYVYTSKYSPKLKGLNCPLF